ncbi:MAG: response regulator transcription factor [Gaiellaceae bacterium]
MLKESAAAGGGASFAHRDVTGRTSVGLVCGDPVWEHAISWLLRSAGAEVVAHARDVDRALDLVIRAAPQVLVVDADEEVEPVRLLRRIRDVHEVRPPTSVVVICRDGDNAVHDAALAAGAFHVVRRDDALGLVRAVDDASAEGTTDPERGRPHLTLREFEILRLAAEGRTNREVARAAWVTEQTVKYHLANIYRRLGVHTRTEALTWAADNGVVDRVESRAP